MGKRGPKPGTGGRPKQTIDKKFSNKAALMKGDKAELNTICLVDNKTALSIYNNTIEWLKGLNCYEDVPRSEERRVGKECTSWCRSRWSPYH